MVCRSQPGGRRLAIVVLEVGSEQPIVTFIRIYALLSIRRSAFVGNGICASFTGTLPFHRVRRLVALQNSGELHVVRNRLSFCQRILYFFDHIPFKSAEKYCDFMDAFGVDRLLADSWKYDCLHTLFALGASVDEAKDFVEDNINMEDCDKRVVEAIFSYAKPLRLPLASVGGSYERFFII